MTAENKAGEDSPPEQDKAIPDEETEGKGLALEMFLRKAKKETLPDWLHA
jgi:hypothetical protein